MVICTKCKRKIPGELGFGIIYSKERGYRHRMCPKRKRKSKQGRIAKPKAPCRGLNHDLQAMGEFRFQNGEPLTDLESVIYRDGRQKFEGVDYKARVREVLARDGGKCQWGVNSFGYGMCGLPAVDVHHKVKRSKGRNDLASNLISLCREHHDEMHKEFRTRFSGSKR